MNLVIMSAIVLMSSSSLPDALRFIKCWRAFVDRKKPAAHTSWRESLVIFMRKAGSQTGNRSLRMCNAHLSKRPTRCRKKYCSSALKLPNYSSYARYAPI